MSTLQRLRRDCLETNETAHDLVAKILGREITSDTLFGLRTAANQARQLTSALDQLAGILEYRREQEQTNEKASKRSDATRTPPR